MELLYNQKKIPSEKWHYGLRASAAVGCGWIATYNALVLMGYKPDPEKLISWYEHQLPVIHGNAGTSFWGPAVYFRKSGFPVEVTSRQDQFDAVVDRSDVCILFYWWRQKWKLGAHFVALHRTGDTITGYNTYSNSTGPDSYGASLQAFLKKRQYFGTFLLGIKNKKHAVK